MKKTLKKACLLVLIAQLGTFLPSPASDNDEPITSQSNQANQTDQTKAQQEKRQSFIGTPSRKIAFFGVVAGVIAGIGSLILSILEDSGKNLGDQSQNDEGKDHTGGSERKGEPAVSLDDIKALYANKELLYIRMGYKDDGSDDSKDDVKTADLNTKKDVVYQVHAKENESETTDVMPQQAQLKWEQFLKSCEMREDDTFSYDNFKSCKVEFVGKHKTKLSNPTRYYKDKKLVFVHLGGHFYIPITMLDIRIERVKIGAIEKEYSFAFVKQGIKGLPVKNLCFLHLDSPGSK